MPGGETATRHATLSADTARRRRYAHPGHRNVGQPIWSLWLSSDHGAAQRAGWKVGKDRVERIWRREGLKVPKKQKPRGRLSLNDGSCVRLRPQHANHVWSYDFVSAKTHDGRTVRMLSLIDEHTRESLLVRPERRWSSAKVIESLADVMVMKGVPEHSVRTMARSSSPRICGNGWLIPAQRHSISNPAVRGRTATARASTQSCGTSSSNGEIFYSSKQVQVLAERLRLTHNTIRPHSALGYRSPAPETWQPEVKTGYGEVESKVRFPLPPP